MASVQTKIFSDMITKLTSENNEKLLRKCIETNDLIKVKCNEVMKNLDENTKVILCIYIAAEILNIPIATTTLIKKSQLNKYRKIILKILGLNKKLSIDDVLRKLGITQTKVEKTAKEIFKVYMQQQSYDDDINSSVFVMSVYFACKLEKVKVAKKNIIPLSSLTQSQFANMEKSWEKWTSQIQRKPNSTETKGEKENLIEVQHHEHVEKSKNEATTTEESYEEWSKRILKQAYKELEMM